MRKVAIVTDSTADLPQSLLEQYSITSVPLSIVFGDETIVDGSISQQEFFDRMNAAEELPSTSQPSVGAFVDAYSRALETASEVVSIHISSKLSGTMESARRAAEEFAGRVHVVDSMNLSWGLGFQPLEAARAAAEGLDRFSVIEHVESVRDRVQMIVHFDALDNLVKGGRISGLAGVIGGALSIKLSITIKDGAFVPVRPYRNAKSALKHGLSWVETRMGGATRGAFCVMHALSEDRAIWLEEQLRERFDVTEMHVVETGAVIATHTGTGWAVAFVPEG